MNEIPNWFRWLVIVIATLIMCACRSPLQEGQPRLASVAAGPGFQVQDVVGFLPHGIEAKAAAISKKLHAQPARLDDTTDADPPQSTSHLSRSDLAPVVTRSEANFQIRQVDPQFTRPAQNHSQASTSPLIPKSAESGAQVTQVTKAVNSANNAVYVRVNDHAAEIEMTNAQLDAEIGTDLGSPFVDDPVAPVPLDPPQAPSIEPGFREPQQQLETILSKPILSADTPLPSDGQSIILSTEPCEDCFPCEDAIVEVAPENWATDPSDLKASQNGFRLYPDEYICDGGDAAGRVQVMSDWSLRNLDPEDTIGHYDGLDHRVVVEPSNRVCIYAPRFAAARKISAPFQNEQREQAMLTKRQAKAVIEQGEQLSDQYSQTLAPQRHLGLQPPSGLRVRQPGVEAVSRQAVNILGHDLSVHEDFRVIKYGVHKQSEKAQLAEFAAKAVTWSHDKAVQVILDEEVVQTQVSRQGPGTIYFIGAHGPAKLRVIKTASSADALPGEEVEFTLRFDNVGYQKIGNVTIIDNLTTRLEFIDDSDLCSEECEFIVDQNAVESLTLRWEIKDPIDPGQGGLIRFRCRVR